MKQQIFVILALLLIVALIIGCTAQQEESSEVESSGLNDLEEIENLTAELDEDIDLNEIDQIITDLE